MTTRTKTPCKTSAARFVNQQGFTIIEMAIVTIIIGMVFAGAMQIYEQRQRFVRVENTKQAISNANLALADYLNDFGRYPCPASLNATRTNNPALYGVESNCADDAAVAPGTGVDNNLGYAVIQGERNVFYFDRSTPAPTRIPAAGTAPVRVRIGTLPFKNLNLEESEAYDGYKNRLIYAIVEPLAVQKTFDAGAGAINIVNQLNLSVLEPQASAHFILLSAGENGAGAYNYSGNRMPCLTTSQESENCDYDTNATFKIAQTGTINHGAGATYDDLISYRLEGDIPMWETQGGRDAFLNTVGDIGIGSTTAANNPGEDLQVDGTLIARDDPGTPGLEGLIESETICDFASGSTTCFTTDVITGDLSAGEGLSCPTGTFMTGIQNSGRVCTNEIIAQCPPGDVVTGIDGNGDLVCSTPPPGCPSLNVSLCTGGPSELLPASPNGAVEPISVSTNPGNPGGTRTTTYRCDAGTWTPISTTGDPCSCTPVPPTTHKTPCNMWNSCNGTFSGEITRTTETQCPSGTTNTSSDYSSCSCIPGGQRTYVVACDPGFNKGRKIQIRQWSCDTTNPTTGSCSFPTPVDDPSDSCRCEDEAPVALPDASCPPGLNGSIPQTRQFTCPGGPNAPGTTTVTPDKNDPAVIAAHCSCSTSAPYTERRFDCPAGHSGHRIYTITPTCDPSNPLDPPATTETVAPGDDHCVLDPMPQGLWQDAGGPAGLTGSSVTMGNPCTIGDTPPLRLCTNSSGQTRGCACQ